jgi:predicted amidohydrolase YtcJ
MTMPKADVVLRGGRIFCGLADGFAEALALWSGRVLAAGPESEVDALVGPSTRVIDLRGRSAYPGLNDAHQHMMNMGMGLTQLGFKTETRLAGLLDQVRARAKQTPPGQWILGRGYDHFELDAKRHPFREELDAAAPDNPVYIVRTCGHMGVANSRALTIAGIDEKTPQPVGGHIESQNGRLTGLLQETARNRLTEALPDSTLDDLIEGIRLGQEHNLSEGFTSVTDPAVGLKQGYDDYRAYQTIRRQGGLRIRVHMMPLGGENGWHERAYDLGLMTGDGDEWLRVGPMKLFADGSAGGKTAAMTYAYKDTTDNFGIMIYPDEAMFDYVADYHRRGFQIATHAIGDKAIEQVLTAYELAMGNAIDATRRHRIEHCGFVRPDQIARMARLGVLPAPQSIFIYEFGDLYLDALGGERPAFCYPMRAWHDAGLFPSASSDAPVSSTNPFRNIYTMVTRRTSKGTLIGADQALSMAEAIHAYTYNGAYGSFEEGIKGRLVPGQLADVAVADRDLFSVPHDQIVEAANDLTIVGGDVVYDRLGETA